MTKTEIKKIKNKKNLIVVLSILCLGLFFGKLFITNEVSIKYLEKANLENEIKELEDVQKRLTVRLSDLKKIATIEEYSEKENMVEVGYINYIVLNSNMAMK
ncbi:hypothetical protein K9L04_00500 [Patescibacteria group bacterium]|nr:hypothetical protein [Patescibacteria group bacterium]